MQSESAARPTLNLGTRAAGAGRGNIGGNIQIV
jgi:hypothetical protein